MKAKEEKIIYKGVVITKLGDGLYRWYGSPSTLEVCKIQIDNEFGGKSPLGNTFDVIVKPKK